jgi:hypothetical protein
MHSDVPTLLKGLASLAVGVVGLGYFGAHLGVLPGGLGTLPFVERMAIISGVWLGVLVVGMAAGIAAVLWYIERDIERHAPEVRADE